MTKRNNQLTRYKKEFTFDMLRDEIIKHRGNMTEVAKAVKVTRKTIYNRINAEFPELIDVISEARDIGVDEAEGFLRKRMESGDTTAIIFYLKTQGRWRGYIERQDNLNINIDVSKMTDEQLLKLANGEDIRAVLATTSESTT